MRNYIATVIPAFLLLGSLPAVANELTDDTVSTCTTNNCSSVRLPGTVFAFVGNAHPWITQVYIGPNECVRLQVLSQGDDLELTAVAPDGTTYQNDDVGLAPCPLCSLVKFATTGGPGWSTVQVSLHNGSANSANFILAYARHPISNPNCSATTRPLVPSTTGARVPKPAG